MRCEAGDSIQIGDGWPALTEHKIVEARWSCRHPHLLLSGSVPPRHL